MARRYNQPGTTWRRRPERRVAAAGNNQCQYHENADDYDENEAR